jgi:hypothetical protein
MDGAMGDAVTAAAGLVGGSAESVGQYTWCLVTDRWWWSDGTYRIHGFAPGEVVPTTELLMAHKHPDDVGDACLALNEALTHGGPYSCYHRIIDAHRKVRSVVVAGAARADSTGRVVELRGFLVDLTAARRRDHHADVQEAVEAATRHRATIDQAKGMLMLAYGVDAAAAFAILVTCSQNTNTKVNQLAARMIAELPQAKPGNPALRRRLETLLQHPRDPAVREAAGHAAPAPAVAGPRR